MTRLEKHLRDSGIDTTTLMLAAYQRPADAITYHMRFPAQQAVAQWERLRRITPPVGYWPIIGWDRFQPPIGQEETTANILLAAEQLDVQRLLSEPDLERLCIQSFERGSGSSQATIAAVSNARYRIPYERFPHTPAGFAPIALVPCGISWEVPAFLRFSEDTNLPQEHIAVQKRWYERWGAELVGWDSAQAELYVPRPPSTADEACKLAVEHFRYCPDLVEQNSGTVEKLAQMLINSHLWWFWWD